MGYQVQLGPPALQELPGPLEPQVLPALLGSPESLGLLEPRALLGPLEPVPVPANPEESLR